MLGLSTLHGNRVRRAPVTSLDYRLQLRHVWSDFSLMLGVVRALRRFMGFSLSDSFLISSSSCSRTTHSL